MRLKSGSAAVWGLLRERRHALLSYPLLGWPWLVAAMYRSYPYVVALDTVRL